MAFLKSVIYVLVLGIAAHFIGEALPRRWFRHDRFPFRTWKWERNGTVYEKIRVQDWKDHVPDLSRVMKDMVPKRVGICPTSKEVRTLVVETCVAEFIHSVLCVLSLGVYLFWKNRMGVFLSAVVVLCNLPFIFIQRYNRPMLVSLADRLEIREERRRKRMQSQEIASGDGSGASVIREDPIG
jgi:glycosyl-4,4'-diaponeurosporenoate acyltransferase